MAEQVLADRAGDHRARLERVQERLRAQRALSAGPGGVRARVGQCKMITSLLVEAMGASLARGTLGR